MMAIKKLMLLYLLLIVAGTLCSAQSTDNGNKFKAAVVKIDITPDDNQMLAGYPARKSTGILHRIYHKILVLDDGATKFFLVSTDLGKIAPSEYDKVAEQLKKQFGIERQNFFGGRSHIPTQPLR